MGRHQPQRPPVTISELAWLVVVPGRPPVVQSFTAAQRGAAEAFAAETGGRLESLPLAGEQ